MKIKRDTCSQDEDAVEYRTEFFHRLNNDPTFSAEYRKKFDMILSRSFEREQHEASEQTRRETEMTLEATTGSAAEAAEQDRGACEQKRAGREVSTKAMTGTAVEAAKQVQS